MLEPFLSTNEITKISFECGLDRILSGGIESKTITQFYGPPASGKTNLCLLAVVRCVGQGKKAVFIDTEGGHSIERLSQIAGDNLEAVLENSYFYEPASFSDQQFIVENLDQIITPDVGLIVLDSAVAFYRFERNDENASEINKALTSQLALLSGLARKHNLAVIITTQVYASYEVENGVEPVGGSMLKYWSKVIVELKREGRDVEAVLVRHRALPDGMSVRFRITSEGIKTLD
ncbi:MAG TPA: DNA repair and recombination protein RadB [Euryarchaeota archaeon]|nr:DNA repair and recombination protein RadB [archaeon BMS3Abin16]GBE56161.1 DNA repair and recombination protein RadB [archaeon BMS3Bbin16]HDH28423.1 DNA repair and recombination protein RadB [Euryarchaeota archaeon]